MKIDMDTVNNPKNSIQSKNKFIEYAKMNIK
jgi:hypothetical protein